MGRMFEKRKATMFKRWDRMAKAFTRVGKEISIAVKASGPNPDHNPMLRRALLNARACNMPKDRIEAAIAKASGADADSYDELIYEGYAPHGVALVIVTATDNPTRTVANVRLALKKGEGNLGASGSVLFGFEHQGVFKVKAEGVDADELELELIDHGLVEMERVEADEEADEPAMLVLRCDFTDFGTMQSAVEEMGLEAISSDDEYAPTNVVELGDDETNAVLELIDRLEQDDDVQKVFHNLA
ncbi:MAG: YebC/PmpR family DNA-binding transcriptional regulator [Deltaproteobacteria bacterium]|nr:MAG: YebC/PmpR family DNA-binding transcriptional regulator [Deltaproteobacteria bacterium]